MHIADFCVIGRLGPMISYMYCDYSIVILQVSFFQGLMFEYLEF